MSNNVDVYDEYVYAYQNYKLSLAERKILSVLKDKWHKTKMLDIGVGTGRTTYTFAEIVKEYTGIDYSQNMIKKCKEVIGERDSVKFEYHDATDLSKYKDENFDFVLFSMNGICSVNHEDRLKILSEVHKVMDDDGLFFFSTHSLDSFPEHFPFNVKLPKFDKKKPFHWQYQWTKMLSRKRRMRNIYKKDEISEICNKQWDILITGDHDFKMKVYYIKPESQVKQLQHAGFEVVSVYDEKGNERDPLTERINEYMYFLCKKSKC